MPLDIQHPPGTLNGQGADIMDGGSGKDWLQYNDSVAGVVVDLRTDALGFQSASGGDADGDIISGFEFVIGSAFDDTLIGDDTNNILRGGNGADIIDGQGGNDSEKGGGGADTFVFDLNDGTDTITDFQDGLDMIAFVATAGLTVANVTISASGANALVDYAGGQIVVNGAAGLIDAADIDFAWV